MIEIKDLTKEFQTADGTVEALRNVNLNIQDGDIYGIIGLYDPGIQGYHHRDGFKC